MGAGPVEPGFPIEYVGVLWDQPDDDDHAHDHGDPAREDNWAIRFRTADGQWSAWQDGQSSTSEEFCKGL